MKSDGQKACRKPAAKKSCAASFANLPQAMRSSETSLHLRISAFLKTFAQTKTIKPRSHPEEAIQNRFPVIVDFSALADTPYPKRISLPALVRLPRTRPTLIIATHTLKIFTDKDCRFLIHTTTLFLK